MIIVVVVVGNAQEELVIRGKYLLHLLFITINLNNNNVNIVNNNCHLNRGNTLIELIKYILIFYNYMN